MKFATKFDTEDKLSTVIEIYKTWTRIRTEALIDKPRGVRKKKTTRDNLILALKLISEIDSTAFSSGDDLLLAEIQSVVERGQGVYRTSAKEGLIPARKTRRALLPDSKMTGRPGVARSASMRCLQSGGHVVKPSSSVAKVVTTGWM
jgi:hypothetical protein